MFENADFSIFEIRNLTFIQIHILIFKIKILYCSVNFSFNFLYYLKLSTALKVWNSKYTFSNQEISQIKLYLKYQIQQMKLHMLRSYLYKILEADLKNNVLLIKIQNYVFRISKPKYTDLLDLWIIRVIIR